METFRRRLKIIVCRKLRLVLIRTEIKDCISIISCLNPRVFAFSRVTYFRRLIKDCHYLGQQRNSGVVLDVIDYRLFKDVDKS